LNIAWATTVMAAHSAVSSAALNWSVADRQELMCVGTTAGAGRETCQHLEHACRLVLIADGVADVLPFLCIHVCVCDTFECEFL
jgi:hypothetical protein